MIQCAVQEQRLEVLGQLGILFRRRMDAFLGGPERNQEQHDGQEAEQHDGALRAELLIVGRKLDDEHHETRVGNDAADLRQRHAVGIQARPLQRVIRHHAGQRAVGDVDGGVEQHQQIVSDPRPHELAGGAEVWAW